jgi:hypothetical protein
MGNDTGHNLHIQQKRKQAFRFFVEERLVDMGHLFISVFNVLADSYDLVEVNGRKFAKFCLENKRYTMVGLCMLAVVLAMIL